MDLSWPITGNNKGKKNPSLFTSIELLNYVPDELHILLRITDVLMECIINSTSAIPGLYRKEDVTPYMHILTMHVPFFLRNLNNQGLSFRLFSTSSIEKKNHEQVKLFFGGTTMGGGNKTKPVVYDMMVFENRQIFYLLNKAPKEITCKSITISND
ncbi:17211_t:CDS:2 [Entrophospora sp. SA101]|nr:17211_t:CDS:2 [Entrophospora sp. SA101]